MKFRVLILAMLILITPTTKAFFPIIIGAVVCVVAAIAGHSATKKVKSTVAGEKYIDERFEKEKLRERSLVSSEGQGREKVFAFDAEASLERANDLKLGLEAARQREEIILARENTVHARKRYVDDKVEELSDWVQTRRGIAQASEDLREAEQHFLHLRSWFSSMGQWLWSCIRQHEDLQAQYRRRQERVLKTFRFGQDFRWQRDVDCPA